MKLILALAILGAASSSAFASTVPAVAAHHSQAVLTTLAMAGPPVPEPATLGLLAVGAASLFLRRRK